MIEVALFVALLFGAASAIAGNPKGMGGSGFVLGFLLGPIGLVIVLVSSGNRKQCPACREMIHADASKCRFCGREFESAPMIDCPRCGARYPTDRTGCGVCGHAKPRMAAVTP